MNKIKILSYNAQGLRGRNKRAKVINWATKKNFDIMAIQESHFQEGDRTNWEEHWKGAIISSCWEKSNARGVTFLLREDLNYKLIQHFTDKEGRWVILDMEINKSRYTMANYYGPNDDHPWHLCDMISKIDELGHNNLIIMGDFNIVLNIKLDKLGGRSTTHFKCRQKVLDWMEEKNLLDIWRIKNPNTRKYTWTSNHKPPIKCRLDFFLISDNLTGHYKNCDIVPGLRSDHNCATLTLENLDLPRGRGLWKFNSSLLHEERFKEEVINTIKSTAENNKEADKRLLWDTMKCCIRGTCIGYAISKKKRERQLIEATTNEIVELEDNQNEAIRKMESEDIITAMGTEIREKKKIIEDHIEKETRARAIRSKSEWYEQGDSSSKLFLNLEKSRGEKKAVKRLRKSDGHITTDQTEILSEEEIFYKKLYTSSLDREINGARNQIFQVNSPKVDPDDKENLEKLIEEQEIWEIVKESPANKSPGTDGFTSEFYQAFWPHIKKHIVAAFNEALEEGELSISQKRGVITLIPKPQKDLDLLKNWRPITLLNQDYKYLAKAIANRCKKLLPALISYDQTGFVPGRYIGCNIQRIQSLIEKCDQDNINGVLINIDFEKAFDSIEWSFVVEALKFFNFPQKFISWTRCLYNNIETCIINNGHLSKFFKPQRGVRQGCPLSPYIFVIAAELLSLYVKQHPDIRGIKTSPSIDYTISQFADDTSIAIIADKKNIESTFNTLEKFSKSSGLKINVEKSEILLLGGAKAKQLPKNMRKLVKEELRILGLKISKDNQQTTSKNYQEALDKMKATVDLWKRRQMSLAGKICIIKTMITSKLQYCMNNLASPPKEFWKEVEELLYNFLNDNKPDKIKRETLIGPYEQGGYKMLDISAQNHAMKMNWAKRLVETEGVWKQEMINMIPTNTLYFLRCNLNYVDIPFKPPKGSIWEEFWPKWCKQNYKNNVQELEEILNQNIWYNSHIRINKKPTYIKTWADKGILWINDLVKENPDGTANFKTIEELEGILEQPIPRLTYMGLMAAIPQEWKRTIRLNEDTVDNEDYKLIDQLMDTPKASRVVYDSIINTKCKPPLKAIEKWQTELATTSTAKEIMKAHTSQRKGIINNKIRSYNYKFMLRIVPTQRRLFLLGKATTEDCQICNTTETISHLYWDCPCTKRLWERLKSTIEEKMRIIFPLCKERCLIGTGHGVSKTHLHEIQQLCNLTKYYIHLNKCNKTKSSPEGLDSFLKSKLRMEKHLYMEKGRVNLFQEKWGELILWSENQT